MIIVNVTNLNLTMINSPVLLVVKIAHVSNGDVKVCKQGIVPKWKLIGSVTK